MEATLEKTSKKLQILTWSIKGQLYGADIHFCMEVQKDARVIDVPQSKSYVAGIVNLRGDVVTVLDLLSLMDLEKDTQKEKSVIIRMKYQEKQIAIKADNISEVLEIPHQSLESADLHLSEKELQYISYVANTPIGLVLILNVEELFVIK
ncbi:MAG: chemotaxis protein CheW [Leptospiraceae bacterium]|nr:chemotaxis protein CheW [Leptospiraceae bacterium]MCP5495219.1 chemotaxis protein CheW [Leptospiraceae bacterium]